MCRKLKVTWKANQKSKKMKVIEPVMSTQRQKIKKKKETDSLISKATEFFKQYLKTIGRKTLCQRLQKIQDASGRQ